MNRKVWLAVYSLGICTVANSFMVVRAMPGLLWLLIPLLLALNILPGMFAVKTRSIRLRLCNHGAVLLVAFQISVVLSLLCQIVLGVLLIPLFTRAFLWNLLVCFCVEALLFWNGIACVYLTSVQLGIRHRMMGVVAALIPVVNVIVLNRIVKKVFREVAFESEKERMEEARKAQRLCATKYPILLVHGVFFRDNKIFNYWGRIPKTLEKNGAAVFYGKHQSAASVADSARELTARIRQILEVTGCEKVNIIAHSKGGLDCRYAMAYLNASPMIASLTTINTPHRGCIFADYLLKNAPEGLKHSISDTYNKALRELGDENPDFMAAVEDLTASVCVPRDAAMVQPEGVYCQSFGSRMGRARKAKFPLSLSYHVVKFFDGPNDGLVSVDSFAWGDRFTMVNIQDERGINHMDMTDLTRENIDGFDVREFYVNLVRDLKDLGL